MISIIVAVAENGVIGSKNRLIWHIREDLQRFKRITSGHPVVMGRKTFESLDRKPLPGRANVVVTRDPLFAESVAGIDVVVVHSLQEALTRFLATEELFIIGGGEIYREAMPLADKLYLTRIGIAPEGDTYFPEISSHEWGLVWHEAHSASADQPLGYEFIDYIRIKKS